MKFKIILFIVIVIISDIFIFIIRKYNKKDVKPNINNSNEEKKGRVELVYKINAGIPFKWIYEIEDESIVKFEESYQIRNDNIDGRSGGAIETKYVFKGIKEGTTTITFKYVSIDGDKLYEEYKHVVKVDKDNNAILVEDNN